LDDPSKSHKKKPAFLAFLCCGSSDKSPETDSQDVQPAKPVNTTQPARAQPPMQNSTQPSVPTTDTSAGDDKEVEDEKTAQQQPNGSKPETRLPDMDVGKGPSDGSVDRDASNAHHGASEPGLAQSGSSKIAGTAITAVAPVLATGSTNLAPGPDIAVQAPTPTVPQQEDDAIFDRTAEQQQRDEDIEMKDGNVLTEKEAQKELQDMQQEHNEDAQAAAPVDAALPPPPPGQPSQDTSMVSTPEGTSKWLLPPIRPEHKGRKCLVLDLDETLVHSSFKVRPPASPLPFLNPP
jgi:RNA polymerase II subunit A small phosphatase-like protein